MQLRTEIEIDAPPERVWQVLTELASFPEWNPFITSIEGALAPGARQRITMVTSEGDDFVVRAEVLKVDAPRELRWRDRLWLRGLLDGEHFVTLVPLEGGRTRLLHGEDFRGLLLDYMGNRLTHTARGFVGMNEALKRRVESAG